ncbi:MAG TPA: T9SS type A sorting domain-containing protein, partial [Saprospiraceae bacterium]|nr:T9SS type A sorting domain-containing protein [Saprospiraceae bacterium]
TATISNLTSGTYAVSVTDADGCTASGSTFVSQPFALSPNASTTGETGVGFQNGSASAAPSGGTPPYGFLWSNDSTSATITGLAPGNYTVSVNDANGCTAVQTVTVNAFGCNLSLVAFATPVTCHGAADGTATVQVSGANGAVGYAWSSGANTQTASNLGPGTYTVTVVDASNCEAVQTVQVNEPAPLLPNATATGQTGLGLNDGTATAAPTGGTSPYTYLWSNGEMTPGISGLAPNTYTVVVSDSKGCTASQSVTVSGFNCALNIGLSAQSPRCFGFAEGSATATVSGATGLANYAWSNGGNTATIANLPAGTYTVTVSDEAGCSSTSSISITQPQPLTAAVSEVVNVACPLDATGSAVVTASGGTAPYGYGWPGGSGNGTGLQAGTYTVSVTDAQGCLTTTTVSIASLDTQPPTLGCPGNIVNCGADIINYTFPFSIDNCSPSPVPVLVSGQASGTAFNDGVTVQVFRATDLSGNSATCSFSVTIFPLADVVLTGSGPDINGMGVGFINIQVVGTGPFSYVWRKDGEVYSNEQNLDSLKAGVYRLNVTDGNGCLVQLAPVTISNTVGTDDPAALAGLRLWPNPVQAAFRVELNGLELSSAGIFTPQGRLVRTLQPAALLGEVEVSDLPAGVYYLRVITSQGWQGALKWVKSGQ